MKYQHIRAICLKDWKELAKSRYAIVAMTLLPLIMFCGLPVLIFKALGGGETIAAQARYGPLLERIPPWVFDRTWTPAQRALFAAFTYSSAPLFLLVPVVVVAVTAAQSFAGEKEQHTIEGLLYTPISDSDLVLAKVLASFVPALAMCFLGFALYSLMVNVLASGVLGRLFFPTPTWWVLALWFAPSLSFLCLTAIVLVSERARSAWEAQQVSALLVVPLVALVTNQAAMAALASPSQVFGAGSVLAVVDVLAYRWVVRRFDRERVVTVFA